MRAPARLPERVELAAYYIVSEALANAAKHARASVVQVSVEARDGTMALQSRAGEGTSLHVELPLDQQE